MFGTLSIKLFTISRTYFRIYCDIKKNIDSFELFYKSVFKVNSFLWCPPRSLTPLNWISLNLVASRKLFNHIKIYFYLSWPFVHIKAVPLICDSLMSWLLSYWFYRYIICANCWNKILTQLWSCTLLNYK